MTARYHKEKAFHAINFFLAHTSVCNKKKTYKLLWFLDSEFFQMIGRSVTGYQYFAWKMGPVPTELHEAIEAQEGEFEEFFDVERRLVKGYETISLISKKPFDERYFSKKELDLLNDLSNRFDLATGKELEDLTHQPGTPWHQVWEIEGRKQAEIPFEYAISLSGMSPQEKDIVASIAKEREAFLVNYR